MTKLKLLYLDPSKKHFAVEFSTTQLAELSGSYLLSFCPEERRSALMKCLDLNRNKRENQVVETEEKSPDAPG